MADERITKPARDVRMDSKREYSEIEIEVAKNLIEKGYEWIARDENDALYAFKTKPRKGGYAWNYGGGVLLLVDENARGVIPIFDIIRWEDDDPVSLHDVVPRILTDEERDWLRTVVRPFRDRLRVIETNDGEFYGRYVSFIIAHSEKWRDGIGEDMEHTLLPVPEDWFKGIRNYNKYTPEELGL